jgi:hypothetical protein
MLRVCDREVDAQEEPMYGARARMSGLVVCEVVCGGRVCRCWREKVKLSDDCFGGTAGLKCFPTCLVQGTVGSIHPASSLGSQAAVVPHRACFNGDAAWSMFGYACSSSLEKHVYV